MKKLKYTKVKQGDTVILPIKNKQAAWNIKCCDCALEHAVLFRTSNKELAVSIWRMDDLRATMTPKEHYKYNKKESVHEKPQRQLKARHKRWYK